MDFTIDSFKIHIAPEGARIRLTTNYGDNLLLSNVSAEEAREVVSKNYLIVKNHYRQKNLGEILQADIESFSLKIVFRYFYMYQMWRGLYKFERNRDLTFLQKDFDNIETEEVIFLYFKEVYPDDYVSKCVVVLRMSIVEFNEFEQRRNEFYNK